VFSIVNGVLLKPLPFYQPDRIMKIGSMGKDGKLVHMSVPDFIDYREQTHSFVATAAIQDRSSANLSIVGADPRRLNSASVGAQFFDLLGVQMQVGRGFIAGDDATGAAPVVVLSDKLWRSTFGADVRVVGRPISLNGKEYTVVGVAPPSLTYPSAPGIWVPFVFESWMTAPDNRGAHFMSAIARLRPGVSEEAATRDMATVGARLRAEYPRSNATFGGTAENLQRSLVGDVRTTLLTMFGAVTFVLLIACANVANLLLVRAAGRETEIAVRTALGAGRGRIIRQLVTESVLLSVAGAMIGGALAGWIVDAIVAFGPKGLPRLENIAIDGRVLAFSVTTAIITGLLFGLVPAFHAARAEIGQMLKESVRSSSGRRAAQRTRSALVMTEMALAVVLLVGAGLLIRSFATLLKVDPGFSTENIVSFDVSVPSLKYPNDRDLRRFSAEVQANLAAVPGVQSVAVAFARPMAHNGMRVSFEVDGRPTPPDDNRPIADVLPATSNFFSTMGIPVVRGRTFSSAEERWGPPPVVVVNKAFVAKYFPTEDPLGKHITLGVTHDSLATPSPVVSKGEIVGVVGNVRQFGLREDPLPAVYLGWGTFPINDMSFLVRSHSDPAQLLTAIRERVRTVDPTMPIYNIQTMEQAIAESVAQPRFYTLLLTGFAGLALLLAALGIYGVVSYSVSQRTRELGIRIALGATHDRVVRLVIGQGMALTVAGVVVGLVGAYWLVHLLATLLYGVTATDAPTFLGVSVVLLGVASLASYVPARRASRVDPVVA
ncbi:MAG TPA: ABC transporter permease, partial [Gemmatimonadaceae bacterium]|nr:ABC transporter permease [Gemmatimonadaceae bacterium]